MSTEQLENLEQLGRRAVACKHWRWKPGMRALSPLGLSLVLTGHSIHDGEPVWRRWADPERFPVGADLRTLIPDLSDPATLGCLLALVREAHNAPGAYLMGSVSKQWTVHHFAEPEGYWKPLSKWQPTEAEALVAALEAAP